ncbi:hypothetical protein [Microtetraspora sp. NBRC 13810]|uniref:hypothetical protein n=1 Tax=Microtetraspora sp. NBRC 13810 TaxID=3030990 RepID=UPI00255283DC|nr:hypothetical protein [Microtetraspora sp. NBRC 13810]
MTLTALGAVSLVVLATCAAQDDDDDVTADCVEYYQPAATPTPTPSFDDDGDDGEPTPTPSAADFGGASIDAAAADGTYRVVDDEYCDDDDGRSYYGSHGAYRWYYGGVHSGGGARVGGGTTLRPSDVNITSRTGKVVQRGGFGGHGSSGG